MQAGRLSASWLYPDFDVLLMMVNPFCIMCLDINNECAKRPDIILDLMFQVRVLIAASRADPVADDFHCACPRRLGRDSATERAFVQARRSWTWRRSQINSLGTIRAWLIKMSSDYRSLTRPPTSRRGPTWCIPQHHMLAGQEVVIRCSIRTSNALTRVADESRHPSMSFTTLRTIEVSLEVQDLPRFDMIQLLRRCQVDVTSFCDLMRKTLVFTAKQLHVSLRETLHFPVYWHVHKMCVVFQRPSCLALQPLL